MPTSAAFARWILLAALLPACGTDPADPESTSSGELTTATTTSTGDLPTGTDASSTTTTVDPTTTSTSTGEPVESDSESSTTSETTSGTTDDASTTGDTTGDTTTGAELDILELLQAIDGMTVTESASKIDGYRCFHLFFEQPADHDAPDGLKFAQEMTLLHRDRGAPLVLATDGYSISANGQGMSEPADLLHANQLRVEHRFFAQSRPDPADWSTLTIAQAAADHHRISAALHPIYGAAWISTGASKGGMTAIYHRRFYPGDVDGTVAYVAPLSQGTADPRYIDFLENVGDPACRQDLTDVQRELLKRRKSMLVYLEQEATEEGYTYDILGEALALEIVTLELAFAFWQYSGLDECDQIPGVKASDAELWEFLSTHNPAFQQADDGLLNFEPYYWQAAVQLGAPALDEAPLADLLMFPGADVPATFVVPGPGKDPTFDPAAMIDIADWVATDGERLLFIYGENDPWSAGAFELGAAEDAHKLFVADGNHGSKIATLGDTDRDLAHARLEAWTGVTPEAPTLPPEAPEWPLGALRP